MTTRRRETLAQRIRTQSQRPDAVCVPITIASVRFDLVTSDPVLEQRLRHYFTGYQGVGAAQAELWLEPLVPPADLPDLWEDEDSDFHSVGEAVIHRDFVARRLPSASATEPQAAVALVNGELDDSFHNLLRWFAPRILLANRCFLLHAAGLVKNGEGYVFFGQSGAGKSTTTCLITQNDDEAIPLGDDAVIIQIDLHGNPVLHSAPLGCGYTRQAPPACSAPISGLFNLRQAAAEEIKTLSASQGVAALLASAMNTAPDADLESRFDLAERFADSPSGISALHFALSPTFWRLVLAEKSRTALRRPHGNTPPAEKDRRQNQVP